jgi:phosphatidate cytidylyltransferase
MTRVLTAAIGLPLVVAITYQGGWLFTSAVAIVAAISFDEFLNISAIDRTDRVGRWFLPFGAAVTASFFLGSEWIVATLAISILVLMSMTLASPVSVARNRVMGAAAGLVYTCLLPGFLIMLTSNAVLVLLGVVWAGDSAAYYGGRAFGRHRLAAVISPKKTAEGAVVGTVASLIVGIVLARVLIDESSRGSLWVFGIVVLATAVAAQLGDLTESSIKRSAGIKDSSALLPGHGGMLDRIDSLLFAAPVFYFLTLL